MARKSEKWNSVLSGEDTMAGENESLQALFTQYDTNYDIKKLDPNILKLIKGLAKDAKIPAFTHIKPYNIMRQEVKEMERLVFWVDIQTIMFTENLSLELALKKYLELENGNLISQKYQKRYDGIDSITKRYKRIIKECKHVKHIKSLLEEVKKCAERHAEEFECYKKKQLINRFYKVFFEKLYPDDYFLTAYQDLLNLKNAAKELALEKNIRLPY